jgi:hypothetical protein
MLSVACGGMDGRAQSAVGGPAVYIVCGFLQEQQQQQQQQQQGSAAGAGSSRILQGAAETYGQLVRELSSALLRFWGRGVLGFKKWV